MARWSQNIKKIKEGTLDNLKKKPNNKQAEKTKIPPEGGEGGEINRRRYQWGKNCGDEEEGLNKRENKRHESKLKMVNTTK